MSQLWIIKYNNFQKKEVVMKTAYSEKKDINSDVRNKSFLNELCHQSPFLVINTPCGIGKYKFNKIGYDDNKNPVINGIKKISKPGCRRYVSSSSIPKVLNGMGISILTTSKGVISNKKAKLFNVGGEILCQVW